MDIFGDDIDSFYHNDDALNENIHERNIEEAEQDDEPRDGEGDGDGDEGKTDENGEPIKVEPKKRSVRRPQVSFNTDTILETTEISDENIFSEKNYIA